MEIDEEDSQPLTAPYDAAINPYSSEHSFECESLEGVGIWARQSEPWSTMNMRKSSTSASSLLVNHAKHQHGYDESLSLLIPDRHFDDLELYGARQEIPPLDHEYQLHPAFAYPTYASSNRFLDANIVGLSRHVNSSLDRGLHESPDDPVMYVETGIAERHDTNISRSSHQQTLPDANYVMSGNSRIKSADLTATCDTCGVAMTGQYCRRNLRRHVESVHDSTIHMYYCDVADCNRSFRRSDALRVHQRKSHPEIGLPPQIRSRKVAEA